MAKVCVILLFAIVAAFPIAIICLGALHIDQCPMEPWVPKFMIVAGASGVLTVLLSMCSYGCGLSESSNTVKCFSALIALLTLFSFAWNIAGSVWIFKKWSSWDKVKDTDQGCYKDLYLFAFAYLIIFWITCPCQIGGGTRMRKSNINEA